MMAAITHIMYRTLLMVETYVDIWVRLADEIWLFDFMV